MYVCLYSISKKFWAALHFFLKRTPSDEFFFSRKRKTFTIYNGFPFRLTMKKLSCYFIIFCFLSIRHHLP